MKTNTDYVDTGLIKKFSDAKGKFDFKKLTILLKELNDNYKRKNYYSCGALIRAILDHVPPTFGCSNFNEVYANYRWGKTDKLIIKILLNFKLDAHDILHRPISDKHVPFVKRDLPSPRHLHILLLECLSSWKKKGKPKSKEPTKKKSGIVVSLKEEDVRWARYSVGRSMWSSFRLILEIDNFASSRGDYVTVSLKAPSSDPEDSWEANNFFFETTEITTKSSLNKPFEIAGGRVEEVKVFISDLDMTHDEKRNKPKYSVDRLQLVVTTKSGNAFNILIKPGWVSLG